MNDNEKYIEEEVKNRIIGILSRKDEKINLQSFVDDITKEIMSAFCIPEDYFKIEVNYDPSTKIISGSFSLAPWILANYLE